VTGRTALLRSAQVSVNAHKVVDKVQGRGRTEQHSIVAVRYIDLRKKGWAQGRVAVG